MLGLLVTLLARKTVAVFCSIVVVCMLEVKGFAVEVAVVVVCVESFGSLEDR